MRRGAPLARTLAPLPPGCALQPMRVLFCCDPGYYQHLAVTLVSLLESNSRRFVDIHLITSIRAPQLERKLSQSIGPFSNFSFTVHELSGPTPEHWHTSHHITSAAYIRLLAAAVLPVWIDKILYLDADLLVLDDLGELWNTELGEAAAAGVPDPFAPSRRAALGIPADGAYVNSGVLLLSLDRWRADGLAERLAAFVEQQGDRLEYHDQDAINAVLQGQIQLLDYRWNLQTNMLRRSFVARLPDRAAIAHAARAPAILHYTTARKPWLFVMPTPRKALYRRFLQRTAWRGTPPIGRGWARLPEHLVNHALYLLGVNYTWDRVLRRTTVGRIIVRSGELLRRLGSTRASVPPAPARRRPVAAPQK